MLCLSLLVSCARQAAEQRLTVFAMDTVMNLTAYGADLSAAEEELRRLEALLARGVEGSAVYALNHGGAVENEELAALLSESARIAEATGGAFDPTLASALELWGFGSGADTHRVPGEEELAEAKARTGMDHVHIDGARVWVDGGAEVDLGGIAKGWAGQRVRETLSGTGSAVLDLGGDVALLGRKPDGSLWRVAVRDPASGGYLGILEAEDLFVMTSGVYERYFEEDGVFYHHILDPVTLRPAESGLVSATVICENGVWADALATAVCVMGEERALALRRELTLPFELILVTDDGRVRYTSGMAFTPDESSAFQFEEIPGL